MHDPFAVLTTPVPAIDEVAAAACLDRHFAVQGSLEPLASERDRNFLVTTPGGKYVLKFANSAEDPEVTAFHTAAMQHLASAAPELEVPRVMETTRGEGSVGYRAADGRQHVVRLVSWLEGTPLQNVERSDGFAKTLGDVAARLGRGLATFAHPASNYALLWDLKRAAHLRKLLDCVEDPALRALCRDRLDRFDSAVAPRLENLPWQVIHNDLNPSNVLMDPDDPARVVAVIDFGDMVRSPRAVDIAVAAAYLLQLDGDLLSDMLDFVAAYSRQVPLDAAELDVLFDLTVTRSTMTVLITHWRAAEYPDNRDYILRSEERARQLLQRLARVDPDEVRDRIRDVCRIDSDGSD